MNSKDPMIVGRYYKVRNPKTTRIKKVRIDGRRPDFARTEEELAITVFWEDGTVNFQHRYWNGKKLSFKDSDYDLYEYYEPELKEDYNKEEYESRAQRERDLENLWNFTILSHTFAKTSEDGKKIVVFKINSFNVQSWLASYVLEGKAVQASLGMALEEKWEILK